MFQRGGEIKGMKLEELIDAIATSDIDRKASDEIIEQLERYEDAQILESLKIGNTCREDMRYQFKDSPEILKEIDKLTKERMSNIVTDVGTKLLECYWDALQLAVKAELGK